MREHNYALPEWPPTKIVGRETAPESLRFYAEKFAEHLFGQCDRHDLVSHLLKEAGEEIERQRQINVVLRSEITRLRKAGLEAADLIKEAVSVHTEDAMRAAGARDV